MKSKPKDGIVPWLFDHQFHIALAVFILLSATIKSLHHCIPAIQGFITSALETTGLIVTVVTIIVNVSDVLTESGRRLNCGLTLGHAILCLEALVILYLEWVLVWIPPRTRHRYHLALTRLKRRRLLALYRRARGKGPSRLWTRRNKVRIAYAILAPFCSSLVVNETVLLKMNVDKRPAVFATRRTVSPEPRSVLSLYGMTRGFLRIFHPPPRILTMHHIMHCSPHRSPEVTSRTLNAHRSTEVMSRTFQHQSSVSHIVDDNLGESASKKRRITALDIVPMDFADNLQRGTRDKSINDPVARKRQLVASGNYGSSTAYTDQVLKALGIDESQSPQGRSAARGEALLASLAADDSASVYGNTVENASTRRSMTPVGSPAAPFVRGGSTTPTESPTAVGSPGASRSSTQSNAAGLSRARRSMTPVGSPVTLLFGRSRTTSIRSPEVGDVFSSAVQSALGPSLDRGSSTPIGSPSMSLGDRMSSTPTGSPAHLHCKRSGTPTSPPSRSPDGRDSTSPAGSPITRDVFSPAAQSILRPAAKRMWRRAEACAQVDSSRVTSIQSPTRPPIVDSPNVYMPPDTPEAVITYSPTPSVFVQTPKRDRYLDSTTPQQECPDTLDQLRALAAHKRVGWAKTLETKYESTVGSPVEQEPAGGSSTSTSPSSAELDDTYPRVEDSGQYASSKGHIASLPQVSPFMHSTDSASQVEPGNRSFVPAAVATPHWYHNPYTIESPTKLTSAHSAQSLVYVPSLEMIHEGVAEDVAMTSAWDEPENLLYDDMEFSDSEFRRSGRNTVDRSRTSPFLAEAEDTSLPVAISSSSWNSDDFGCTKSELEMMGWKFGNPISGPRVAHDTPPARPEQQIASPQDLLRKAVFNPAPVRTPYWYHNHYAQGTPTPLTAIESAESLVFEPARPSVPKGSAFSTPQLQVTAPAERTCIPDSPFLVKCLTPRQPPKMDIPLPAVFELRYALDGTPRLLTGDQMEAARASTPYRPASFQNLVNKILPKPADQAPSVRKLPLRLQNLNSLFGIKEEPLETLLVSSQSDSAKATVCGNLPKWQKETLSAPAKVKQSRASLPALERCKQEARRSPLVARRMGTPASAQASPSPKPADKRKQDSRQTPFEEKFAKKPREHSPLAGLQNTLPNTQPLDVGPDFGNKTPSWLKPTKTSLLRSRYGEDKRKQDERQTPLEVKAAKKLRENSPSPRDMRTAGPGTPSNESRSSGPRSPWQSLSTAKARLLRTSIHSSESQASPSPGSVLSVGARAPLGYV